MHKSLFCSFSIFMLIHLILTFTCESKCKLLFESCFGGVGGMTSQQGRDGQDPVKRRLLGMLGISTADGWAWQLVWRILGSGKINFVNLCSMLCAETPNWLWNSFSVFIKGSNQNKVIRRSWTESLPVLLHSGHHFTFTSIHFFALLN